MDKIASDQRTCETKENTIHELDQELEEAWTKLADREHEIERLEGKVKVMATGIRCV